MKPKRTMLLVLTLGILSIRCGSADDGGDDAEPGECAERSCGHIWECEDELVAEMSQEVFSEYFGGNLEACTEDFGEICGGGEVSEECLGCFDGSVSCDEVFTCMTENCEDLSGGGGADEQACEDALDCVFECVDDEDCASECGPSHLEGAPVAAFEDLVTCLTSAGCGYNEACLDDACHDEFHAFDGLCG